MYVYSYRYYNRYALEMGEQHRPFFEGVHSCADGSKFVLFVSPTIADYCINRNVVIGMDATFKCIPNNFNAIQLFGAYLIIHNTVCLHFKTFHFIGISKMC